MPPPVVKITGTNVSPRWVHRALYFSGQAFSANLVPAFTLRSDCSQAPGLAWLVELGSTTLTSTVHVLSEDFHGTGRLSRCISQPCATLSMLTY